MGKKSIHRMNLINIFYDYGYCVCKTVCRNNLQMGVSELIDLVEKD